MAAVDPKAVKIAVSAYLKNWMKFRNDEGESTQAIADSLGLKSHASIVTYLTPGHPARVSDGVQRHAAQILFGGSRDRLEEEAVKWYRQHRPPLPPMFDRAVAILEDRHGRDFTETAYLFLESAAAHGAEKLTAPLLADQIYDFAQETKKPPLGQRETTDEDAVVGPAALREKSGERLVSKEKPKRRERAK